MAKQFIEGLNMQNEVSFERAVCLLTLDLQRSFNMEFGVRDGTPFVRNQIVKVLFSPGSVRDPFTSATMVPAGKSSVLRSSWIILVALAEELNVVENYYPLRASKELALAFGGQSSAFSAMQDVIFLKNECDGILRGDEASIQKAEHLISQRNKRG